VSETEEGAAPAEQEATPPRQNELAAPPIQLELIAMEQSLDIKKLALTPEQCCSESDDRSNLLLLAKWCRDNGVPLCTDEQLWQQHQQVKKRIIEASQEGRYKRAWKDMKSGTAVMKFLFTQERFYSGVQDWMLLFSHCSMKTSNESVVESMGNVLDRHADSKRGLAIEKFTKEAFIHWNIPVSHKRREFLVACLNRRFDGNSDWHFVTNGISKFRVSEVVDRLMRDTSKLPFLE
jgi:hypothetical protein